MKKAEIDRKFDEIVAFAEVEQFLDTPVKRYSSGMYVRLAFAVAAHLEPEILIVDEVLAVGDAEFQKKCLGKMQRGRRGEGRTVLFVSHNMDADRPALPARHPAPEGKVVLKGPTLAVVQSYAAQAVSGHTVDLTYHPNRGEYLRKTFREIALRDSEGTPTRSSLPLDGQAGGPVEAGGPIMNPLLDRGE